MHGKGRAAPLAADGMLRAGDLVRFSDGRTVATGLVLGVRDGVVLVEYRRGRYRLARSVRINRVRDVLYPAAAPG
jgi:hypothetical protein